MAEALKELSTLDTLRRTVSELKCSLERFINNGNLSHTHLLAGASNTHLLLSNRHAVCVRDHLGRLLSSELEFLWEKLLFLQRGGAELGRGSGLVHRTRGPPAHPDQ